MQGGAGDMVIGGDEFVSPVWQDYNNGSAGSEEGDHVFSFLGNELGKQSRSQKFEQNFIPLSRTYIETFY